MFKNMVLGGLILQGLFLARVALGTSLSPGGTVAITGTNLSADPTLDGDIVAQTDVTFSALAEIGQNQYSGQLFTADLQTVVVRETSSGTLDFYYQLLNTHDFFVDPVSQVNISGFAGLDTDVDYRTDQGGQYFPISASRSVTGGDILFLGLRGPADNVFAPQSGTEPILVKTNAVAYENSGTATISFAGVSDEGAPPISAQATGSTFVPVTWQGAVPEPGSLGLFALAVCGWIMRRKGRTFTD